ncbi:MAG: glycine zipper 2TM domain-containing protein [Proteobacteria bacterium]|nr:glycine zipper 2TM domain-containing protein [Pseudomonadota bacterium]
MPHTTIKTFLSGAVFLAMAGCTSGTDTINIATYAPVIDLYQYDSERYTIDLAQCRELGARAQAAYEEQRAREQDAALASAVVGALIGAAIGNRLDDYDDSGTTVGAIYGGIVGAEIGAEGVDYERAFVKFGPTGIVDQCLTDRGYRILSVEGFGGG